jgi:transposase
MRRALDFFIVRLHPGRQQLPAGLPRVERVIACTPEPCVCKNCGQPTAVIGYEASEQLDVEPARHFVLVTKREKRACRSCATGVQGAPLPARVVDKGPVSDRVVIDTLVSKYRDHVRQMGVTAVSSPCRSVVARLNKPEWPSPRALKHSQTRHSHAGQTGSARLEQRPVAPVGRRGS